MPDITRVNRLKIFAWIFLLLLLAVTTPAATPRIVNIYNFVRENDFRLANSEAILFEATTQQVQLLTQAGLPTTFALQYDALMDVRYQTLFKAQTNFEIAAWWEIPQALAEKAGLKWRGEHPWDPKANVGFSTGYTPEERCKLVDVYMADFKSIFGYYPKTVGSWFIDEVTLAYMAKHYGIVASCNCKDQIGTDFYTLWGGYWNQAYYPSRLNAYMPAQTKAGQIDVPVFRMLGSDPIYQHGVTPGMFTLEPVYRDAGGSTNWVGWFMDCLIKQPALAFGYTQAGQENSFGWKAMKNGLTRQIELFTEESRAGEIRVETLAQSGEWFCKHYAVTPPTAVVALDDWKNQNRKTVWYDSRFYRLNLLWENGQFFIRDLHLFDEKVVSPTHNTALTATSLAYETLPVMDWALWSKDGAPAGIWPVLLALDGSSSPMSPVGAPIIKESNPKELSIEQALTDSAKLVIVCAENKLICHAEDRDKKPLRWAWKLTGNEKMKAVVQSVQSDHIAYQFEATNYELRLSMGQATLLNDGNIQLNADSRGWLVIRLE